MLFTTLFTYYTVPIHIQRVKWRPIFLFDIIFCYNRDVFYWHFEQLSMSINTSYFLVYTYLTNTYTKKK